MACQPCVGCGFDIDPDTGALVLKGIRSQRPNGDPQEWPYNPYGFPRNPDPDQFPPTSTLDICNGLNCDTVTGDVFAFPNSSANIVQGLGSLIGETVDPAGRVTWSLDEDDFGPPNPWNDSGADFNLSANLTLSLTNQSSCRPMLVHYLLELAGTRAIIDSGVALSTQFQGNIWDGGGPYPGDINVTQPVNFTSSNSPGESLDDMTHTYQTKYYLRPGQPGGGGGGGVLGTFLAPNETTHARWRWTGKMTAGSATTRDGQKFLVHGALAEGFKAAIVGWTV